MSATPHGDAIGPDSRGVEVACAAQGVGVDVLGGAAGTAGQVVGVDFIGVTAGDPHGGTVGPYTCRTSGEHGQIDVHIERQIRLEFARHGDQIAVELSV